MATKPKARNSRPKAKAKSKGDKEQSERFVETARKLGADESGRAFDRAMKIISSRRKN